jgi:uncharacterized membrane protein YccF (DUF307 family)
MNVRWEDHRMKQIVVSKENPGCLVQLLWFALIGWWAGQLWIAVAWLLIVTIVGIPFGIAMLNRLPQVIALRGNRVAVEVSRVGNLVVQRETRVPQHNIVLRVLYFVLIGWWVSALWMEAAYALCLSIIGLPIGFWMFDQVPALLTLRR